MRLFPHRFVIQESFENYGKVERVKKIKDYAFVHFEDRDNAVLAMRDLDGKDVGGSHIEVGFSFVSLETFISISSFPGVTSQTAFRQEEERGSLAGTRAPNDANDARPIGNCWVSFKLHHRLAKPNPPTVIFLECHQQA
jgi:RNA recognition motif-containing protein